MVLNKEKFLIVRVIVLAALLSGMFGSTAFHSVYAATKRTGVSINDSKDLQPIAEAEALNPSIGADSLSADSDMPGAIGTLPSTNLLQYAIDGHLLGFAPDKVYLAGLDHALTVEFSGGSQIDPVGSAASTSIKSSVPALGRVTYQGVWPGVDVVYTSAQGSLVESTYIVQPGAHPADIHLKYNTPVQLIENGILRFDFESGYMTESAPIAFQNINGNHHAVDVRFTLTEGFVGFTVGDYDPNYALTIDPLYTWHTFYGTSQGLQGGVDEGKAITTDVDGNIYVAGTSESTWSGPGNVAPLHAFSGTIDIVVIKLNSAGAYQWHTFYGGLSSDYAYAITSDTSGIYVSGSSAGDWSGPAFPLHAYLGANSKDIVVLKLNSAGAYQWHTFYGGPANTGSSSGEDYGYAIARDATGIYISGYSELTWNGPGNVAPLNPHPGYAAIVVLKLSSDGAYRWHTFYGSGTGTFGYALASDGNGNVYAAGTSGAWNGPGNAAPLNAFSGGSSPDIVVVKLNSAGAYQWHTFYGSSAGWDIAYALTNDPGGNVIVAGYSNSIWNGPKGTAPLNTYEGAGNYKLTVLKLNSAGAYQWHTFYNQSNNAYALTSDERGDIYVISSTSGWDGPGATAPLNAAAGGFDIMLLKLNSAGAYQWHSFYGSTRNDYGYAMTSDGRGNMIVAGTGTGTWNGPGNIAPLNPYKHAPNTPGSDILVVKLDVTLLTVTIEQSASQPDPTSTSPVTFDVVFSAPVTGFDGTDVNLSASTAPGTLSVSVTEVAPNDGTRYSVSVSGMTGSGNVIASIPAGRAQDAAANSNEASTSVDNSIAYEDLTLTVTKADDTDDSLCDSDCSLREALANIGSGGTITFDSSLAGQTLALSSTLVINKSLTIDGAGLASPITISGNNSVRVFQVNSGATVTLNRLTISNGNSTGNGGAIYNDGDLTVSHTTFVNNVATGSGGAIHNGNGLHVNSSTFVNNRAQAGGAIYIGNGIFSNVNPSVVNSTFVSNLATGQGGAIHSSWSAIGMENVAFLAENTFSENGAGMGGGLYNEGSLTFINNIFANSTGGGDCYSLGSVYPVVVYGTNNLIEDGGSCITENLVSGDPLLGPLADNGGPTQTLALLPGSPAIDAGTANCQPTDQRGMTRPQGVACDIGAYESYDATIAVGETRRVSVNSIGEQTTGYSFATSLSESGRYIAFTSYAPNLVSGDTNQLEDIFIYDLQTGLTRRVSVDSSGAQANGSSGIPSLSADGRYVAFTSYATNLVPDDTNGRSDIFLHDLQTGLTTRVSLDSSGAQLNTVSSSPALSGDGRYVAFQTYGSDILIHDIQTGLTTGASVGSGGTPADQSSSYPSLSGDGRYMAFESPATNLVLDDTNGTNDIFVRDMQADLTRRVSIDSNNIQANSPSYSPSISSNGHYVAFQSYANNLVVDDTNDAPDIFVYDLQTNTTRRVSMNSDGVQANGSSYGPSISADGRYVAFISFATNLVPNDTNGTYDIFVHDLQTNTTSRVSVDSNGLQANDYSSGVLSISADGSHIAFESEATNLVPGDTNLQRDIFVHRQNILSTPPTPTASVAPPQTETPTSTPTSAPTGTPTSTGTATSVFTPTVTATYTAPPTSTGTYTPTPTPTTDPSSLFHPYIKYVTGQNPQAVGIGDFNSDGLKDVAMSITGQLLIYLQNTDGSLANPVGYATWDAGGSPFALAVGDLNNDSRADVVLTDGNAISVYLQQPNGTLGARVSYPTSYTPDAVAVGDVNNDGLTDVAVSHWNADNIGIFLQNANGSLNSMIAYPSPQAGYDDIAIGDVNNDGRNDVVKMNGQLYVNPNLSVYLQNANGSLNSAIPYTLGCNCLGHGISIGDVTGDNRADVVMSYGGNRPDSQVAVFAQGSNGLLPVPVSYGTYDIPEPVEIADVNGDGLADVLSAHGGWGRMSVLPQQAGGTLGAYLLYPVSSASHYKPEGLAVGDINHDGLPDVVIADPSNGLIVLYHNWMPPTPTPTFTATLTPTPAPTNTFTPTATPSYSYNPLYLSLTSSQTIGGISSSDEDILRFDGKNWSLFFDGSDVGVASPDLFAFSLLDADTILMSFSANVTVNGITATPQDVLQFDATSLGSATIGTFSMYFDGSDVGFDTTAENIDSLSLLPDGRLLISTTGNPSVPGLTTGKDEDVLAFTPATLGDVTSGTWSMYFDGSDVGLADTSNEDIDALDVTPNGNVYLSTLGDFAVNGLSGADEDVFVCVPTSIGDVTACNYSPNLYFDGSTWALDANDVDAFNFLASGPIPTTVPTNTFTPTATSTPIPSPTQTPTFTATSTTSPGSILTFTALADARVVQASPTTNYGTATTLQADGDAGAAQTSFLRFNVSGISGPIQNAKLRVFCTTNGTNNGPAAYLANNTWTESGTGGITWNTQPALLSAAYDNKGVIAASSWVEYNVTALVAANGTYTFALVADSADGIVFSSREGTTPPQLVLTFGAGGSTSTPTPTNLPSATNTSTSTVTSTATQTSAATNTSTPTATATGGSTPTSTPTPTQTSTPTATSTANPSPTSTTTQTATASTLTFSPIADTYVDANSPTMNYGTATTFRVDASPVVRSYLRFNVQGVNGNVTRATLRVFANSASSLGCTANSVNDNTWTETTLIYNNAPALGSALSSSGTFTAGTWISLDVTAYITGDGTYDLALTTPSSTAISFASRESGANAPQLIIETSP